MLFLTSNRVTTFDSAFTSRIHVALHYRALSDADRERIWINGFERLERESGGAVHVGVGAREYAYESADVRSLRWNGREIRNALQSAVALAEGDALDDVHSNEDGAVVRVTDRHLRHVVRMSRGFKDFLESHRHQGLDEERSDDGIYGNDVEGSDRRSSTY